MAKRQLTVAVYAEQCVCSGSRCYDEEMIESESQDVIVYRGSLSRLAQDERRLRRHSKTAGAGSDLFLLRCADTLRAAIIGY